MEFTPLPLTLNIGLQPDVGMFEVDTHLNMPFMLRFTAELVQSIFTALLELLDSDKPVSVKFDPEFCSWSLTPDPSSNIRICCAGSLAVASDVRKTSADESVSFTTLC